MIHEIDIRDYLQTNYPLIDVRSPGEYLHGHIPGALNIPLFSDAERAHVGTVYVQQSQQKAMDLGYAYVNPKKEFFISESRKYDLNGKIAVHCWRGGLRSRSFAQHLSDNGFPEVYVIKGGYKSFRHFVLETFDIPCNIQIIGGYTGSGKTYVIRQLKDMGHQAVDLEGLANHKGSSFGDIGEDPQPTVEQFENNLFDAWRRLDLAKPVWLEDESHNIGGVNIPLNLYNQMQKSPVYFLDIPKEERAKHLVSEYTSTNTEELSAAIMRISKRLGSQSAREALDYLQQKKFFETAIITLHYYDKSYLKGLRFHDQEKVFRIPRKTTDPVQNALSVLKYFNEHERSKTYSI